MIPGLEHAEFVRYGAVHRNTYINSPNLLTPALHLKAHPPVSPLRKGGESAGVSGFERSGNPETAGRQLFFAGQLTGVEGYMESAASGILAGLNAARVALGEEPVAPPKETVLGALVDYVANCPIEDFQPMNSNFGILPELTQRHHKRDRKPLKIERARQAMEQFAEGSSSS
jgi:methylenetetrahydrofolate--tRNA-(uracil-5-)-methyltransferase